MRLGDDRLHPPLHVLFRVLLHVLLRVPRRLAGPAATRAAVLALVAGLLIALPRASHAAAPTQLSISAPAAYADQATTLTVRLSSGDAPVTGAVQVDRLVEGQWRPVAGVVTHGGSAQLPVRLAREGDDNTFRATYAGDATYAPASAQTVVRLLRRDSSLRLTGPGRVVDERTVVLEVRWRTGEGSAVAGEVALQRRQDRRWRTLTTIRTGADGRARLRLRPRVDVVLRARADGLDWVRGDATGRHPIDNLPPGRRVALPPRAPQPRVRLPRPQRGVGQGPHVHIGPIPDGVWQQMTGRSWHRGCPVGRGGLRLVRVNFWGYDGYRYRGELVAATDAADNMAGALAEMYRQRLPLRAMYRVDRFGWSRRLQGADDYRSMAAGNTSAFNCRWVVGRPGVRSPHSYGRSLDINPWENPYHSSHGVVPNGWWAGRSHPRVAWRSRGHAVVRIMARHGLRWTYGTADAHHFDVRGGYGRMVLRPAATCGGHPCH